MWVNSCNNTKITWSKSKNVFPSLPPPYFVRFPQHHREVFPSVVVHANRPGVFGRHFRDDRHGPFPLLHDRLHLPTRPIQQFLRDVRILFKLFRLQRFHLVHFVEREREREIVLSITLPRVYYSVPSISTRKTNLFLDFSSLLL